MKTMARITMFALCTALAACSSGGSGSGGGAIFPIQANYVSSMSAEPFGLLKVLVESQSPTAETYLRFSDSLGFDVVVPALEVSDTQVTAAVPPYENPITGQIEAGTVSVQVLQRTGATEELSNPFPNVAIADLPASGLAAGDLSTAFLTAIQSSLQSSATAIVGTSLDTPQNQAQVQAALADAGALLTDLGNLQASQTPLDLGSLGGNQVFLGVPDLADADRMLHGLLAGQDALAQAAPACALGCLATELQALTGAIAAGMPVQAQVDAYYQASVDCAVQNGQALAWRFLNAATAIPSGALTEGTPESAPAQALVLTEAYLGLGALSLAAALDANTPNGVPELLDQVRTYADVAQTAALAALAQAAGDLFTYLMDADDLVGIAQTAPTFLMPGACAPDLTGSWRGQYTFTVTLPAPCPPTILNSGLMEIDLTQVTPAVDVDGTGQITGLTRLNQTNCKPAGKTSATISMDATTNGLTFDGDMTVVEPQAGLSAALPFVGNVGAGLAGESTISGTFVFPNVTGTFKLDRLEP